MRTDVAILGAGPAGLAAAQALLPSGLDITLIDEQQRPGGQIYRQPPAEFQVRDWLSDAIYRDGKNLLQKVSADDRIRWRLGATLLGINSVEDSCAETHIHTLLLGTPGCAEQIKARQVLIAPGCYDMPVAFPGSTLPGVMATGAIQAFLKSQQLIAGERLVLVGTHPLQLVVADQLHRAGGRIEAVIFAQPRLRMLQAAMAAPAALANSGQLVHILKILIRLRRAGIPVRFSETVVQANGASALESVTLARVDASANVDFATRRNIECDRLGVCFGFLASSELTRQTGVEHAWSSDGGGWLSRCDDWMRTNRSGICVAGEITGVAGAQVAAEEGRLAALGILRELGMCSEAEAMRSARPLRRRLAKLYSFARVLREVCAPQWKLLDQLLSDDVILCKCEEISVGEFRSLLTSNSMLRSANATKLLSRAGMGLCQGRYCNYYITRLLADHLSVPEIEVGPFTAQFPIKPVRIADLLRSLKPR